MDDYFFFRFLLYALAPQPLTAEFVFEQWQNKSWGLHDVEYTREEIRIDLASDASSRFRRRRRLYHHYFFLHRADDHEYIESSALQRAYSINHGTRSVLWEFRLGGGQWPPKVPQDKKCHSATQEIGAQVRFAGETRVGRYSAIRYLAKANSEIVEFLFSPDLNCGLVGYSAYEPNSIGLPVKVERLRLQRVELREPDAQPFMPPADYSSRWVDSLHCGN
ncbi:MAG: hypothetical protein JNL62_20135 [Bryobacterales bacterium]|nr:hypothetical protein [Bryobacterales bacterium]